MNFIIEVVCTTILTTILWYVFRKIRFPESVTPKGLIKSDYFKFWIIAIGAILNLVTKASLSKIPLEIFQDELCTTIVSMSVMLSFMMILFDLQKNKENESV